MTDTLAYGGLLGHGKGISRRAFFHTIGATVAGGALVLVGVERLGSMPTAAPASLVRSTFDRHVGDTFRLQSASGGAAELQLFKVRDLRSAGTLAAKGRSIDPERNFSILFRGPLDRPLGQETYRFEHNRIGGFGLFIAPMRAEQDARYYEAIFNRVVVER